MNYLTEILDFNDWLETNQLSPSAIALWYALMSINNKCRWSADFTVPISTLMNKTGCGRSAVYTARNQLNQKGRISFRQRDGRQSANYHLIPFESHVESIAPNVSIAPPPAVVVDESLAAVAQCYEANIGTLSRRVGELLQEWLLDFPPDLICRAINEAAMKNARNMNYVSSIIKRCKDQNIRTVEAFESEKAAAVERRSLNARTGTGPGTESTAGTDQRIQPEVLPGSRGAVF